MANKLVSMQYVRSIIQQLQKGFSQRRIAGELQLSRNTVKQYADPLLDSAYSLEQLQRIRTSKCILLGIKEAVNLGVPVMGQKFFDFVYRLVRQSTEDIFKPFPWIDAMQFACAEQRIDHSTLLCCFVAACEEIIFSSYSYWSYRVLYRIIINGVMI